MILNDEAETVVNLLKVEAAQAGNFRDGGWLMNLYLSCGRELTLRYDGTCAGRVRLLDDLAAINTRLP